MLVGVCAATADDAQHHTHSYTHAHASINTTVRYINPAKTTRLKHLQAQCRFAALTRQTAALATLMASSVDEQHDDAPPPAAPAARSLTQSTLPQHWSSLAHAAQPEEPPEVPYVGHHHPQVEWAPDAARSSAQHGLWQY